MEGVGVEASKISHKNESSVHLSYSVQCIQVYFLFYTFLHSMCTAQFSRVYLYIDSSKKEEARSMWLLLPLCHFSILGTGPFKMKSTSWKLIQFQNLFFPSNFILSLWKVIRCEEEFLKDLWQQHVGTFLPEKDQEEAIFWFLFIGIFFLYTTYMYEKTICPIILNWTRGGFCEGSHLLSRDWLPLRGRDTVHSWRDVWLRRVTERGVQHRWNWWQNKVSTLRTMTDMKTGMSK